VTNDFWLYEKDRMLVGYSHAAGGSKCDDAYFLFGITDVDRSAIRGTFSSGKNIQKSGNFIARKVTEGECLVVCFDFITETDQILSKHCMKDPENKLGLTGWTGNSIP
jgi:hypothetical protein